MTATQVWNNVFLTGATGYFGSHILAELLRCGTGHVTCHLRGGGADRIEGALRKNRLWQDDFAGRFTAMQGDLAQPKLGLGLAFDRLVGKIDCVIHNGANVNYVLGLKQLRAANVVATQDALRLAEASAAPFLFVSTLRLFDHRTDSTPIRERDLVDPQQAMRYGYANTKMLSERLVTAAARRGVATAIFRPGLMCGDGLVGAPNPRDAVTLLIQACAKLGVAPESPLQINSTSVAYGAQGLVALGLRTGAGATEPGSIWHVVHDTATRMTDVFKLMQDMGAPLRLIPYPEWVEKLRASPDSDLAPLIEYFTPDFPVESTRRLFDSKVTRDTLSDLGVTHPETDARFWRANLNGMRDCGVLPDFKQLQEVS
ncbi:MAG: thioester reductase domain-containing protein [Albidovulum sp.]|uniref:thioester reductase domain-containing protein n=1 Tax=Albidovulum sp. TaxID=1872424 RepID=UPI003C94937F